MRLRIMTMTAAVLLSASVTGQEWTRFRGPNGSGVSDVRGLPTTWTEKDFAWKVALEGRGHASPVLWGERLFATSAREDAGQRIVQCLHTSDGRTLWSRSFPAVKHRQHKDNSWASATPAVDDRHVYLAWASPQDFLVVALDHDGKEAWRVDLGGFRSGHGFGVSPIVLDGAVLIPFEHEGQSALIALDRMTGTKRWTRPRRSKTTYSTPCVFTPKSGPSEIIVASYEHGISAIDPATGDVNWETDVFAKGHTETSIASPIVVGDLILGSSGYLGVRKEVIAVRPVAKGTTPQAVYTLAKSAPLVPTPLAIAGLLFLWDDDGVVSCFDVATGKSHWRERVPGSYYSSPISAGGHVYGVSREGDVVVLRAADRFAHVATNPLGEGSHSTPAVAGNTLYFRTFRHLIALKAK